MQLAFTFIIFNKYLFSLPSTSQFIFFKLLLLLKSSEFTSRSILHYFRPWQTPFWNSLYFVAKMIAHLATYLKLCSEIRDSEWSQESESKSGRSDILEQLSNKSFGLVFIFKVLQCFVKLHFQINVTLYKEI